MKLCIVAEAYPYEGEPRFPFVQQLAYSLSNEYVECSVIAPQSITKNLLGRGKKKPYKTVDKNPEGKEIRVFRPAILTFSNTKSQLLRNVFDRLFLRAIRRGVKSVGNCDAVYCYFWHVGLRTVKALKGYGIPVFVQASECDIYVADNYRDKEYIDGVAGVVCASGKNREESIREGLTTIDNTIIAVNGFRKDEFFKKDKDEVRKLLGIDNNCFIVAFLGGFIKRKGLPQLCNVLDRFDDVYSIFIGQGDIIPNCKNILFKGSLDHKQVVDYLCAADVFVLPTEAEGCCNAIIEALACGLPVISSNKSFNDEILDDNCSIRLDEHNENEIYNAILQIQKDEKFKARLSAGALRKAESLTIEKRAKIIRQFVTDRIKK